MGERTSEYWQERFRQLEESQHDTSVQTVQEIEQEFWRAEQALDGKINAWYQRCQQRHFNGGSQTFA